MPAARSDQYQHAHTRAWSDTIASFDGFVIVTPEYNHSTSGVLKNALDYLYGEWNNKAVGFVSCGGAGGARAAEHLRQICGALQMADVPHQVALSLQTEFENFAVFKPNAYSTAALERMLDQVVAWSTALTVCCRRIDGKWLISHEHISLPIDWAASGRAITDLAP